MHVFAGAFLSKFAAFLGSIVLVRILSKADYGVLGYVENLYAYAYLLAGLGLNNALYRWMVTKERPEEKKGVFSYILRQGTIINVAIVLVFGVAAHFVPHAEEFSLAAWLLPLMLLALPFQFLVDGCSFSLRSLFENRSYAVLAIATAFLVISLKVICSMAGGLWGSVASVPLAYAAIASGALTFFFLRVFKGVGSSAVSIEERREMRGYSLQYMVTNGLWALFLQNDILLLGLFTQDAAVVADYKVAYIAPSALAILSSSVGMFVSPYFIRHERDRLWVWRSYKLTLMAVSVLMGGASLVLGVFAVPVIEVVYGAEYVSVAPLMGVLLLAGVLTNGIRYTTANLLAAMGRVKINMIVSFCGIGLQAVLDCMLIPPFGVYGPAFASLATYGLMAAAVVVAFVKLYRTKGVVG